jgi:methyl-accepting chemotaxis protein
MKLWGNLAIRGKLLSAFGLVLALTAVMGGVAIVKLDAVDSVSQDLAENWLPSVDASSGMNTFIGDARAAELETILATTAADRDTAMTARGEALANVLAAQEKFQPLISGDAEREQYRHFTTAWATYLGESGQALNQGAAGHRDQAVQRALTESAHAYDLSSAALDSVVQLNSAGGQAARELGDKVYAGARLFLLIAIGITLVLGLTIALLLSGSLSRPLQRLGQAAEAIAKGDLTVTVEAKGKDEVAWLAHSFRQMTKTLRESMTAIASQASALAATAEQMTQVSQTMSAGAEETAVQANVVARATDGVNRNVQTVAIASEEMSASIQEISKNAADAARVASEAVSAAEVAGGTMSRLGASSSEIGQVVKTISGIAAQTNLLALNATIEAARAGEAGKGFAVVANEVKELAKETAAATEDISRKIQAIQGDTDRAVDAIRGIADVVAQISAAQNTIASAVEEQTATTNEINRNLAEAASGASEIVHNVGGVASAASETTRGANDTQQAAVELARMATALQDLVRRFRYEEGTAATPGQPNRPAPRSPSPPATPSRAHV